MNSLLSWRLATREEIKNFTCTEAPRKSKFPPFDISHPRPWEWVVQKYLHDVRPPVKPPEFGTFGFVGDTLAAMARWEAIDGPGDVFIRALAVAEQFRWSGHGVADELMGRILLDTAEQAIEDGLDELRLSGRVHRDNHASQEMCRKFKFKHTETLEDGVHQVWTARILLPGDEAEYIEPSRDPAEPMWV